MRQIFERVADKSVRHSRLAIGIFLGLLLVSPFVGYWLYSRQMGEQELQVQASLSHIAQIRATTISSFVHERIGDARLSTESPFLREAVRSWIQQGYRDDHTKMQILEQLSAVKKLYGYVDVAVLDIYGNTLISTENNVLPIDGITTRLIERAVASNAVQMSSIDLRVDLSRRIIDVVSPFSFPREAKNGKLSAVMLLRFDPQHQIYPSLRVTPFPYLPNDTLLVEIREQGVVVLNDSRSGLYRYLDVLPISPKQLLDNATGTTAPLSWRLVNGNEDIAAAHAVEGAPWYVISLLAEKATHAIARDTALVAAASSIVTLCVLSIGILLWWKYRETQFKLAALQTEAERRLLQKQYDYLSKYANDMIILTDADYRILQVNDKTLQVLDYSASSLAGQSIALLSTPACNDRLKDNLTHLRRDGTAMFETCHQRRDGTVFPVEVSARTIDFEGKSFSQFICRDITERKEAESKIQSLAYYDSVTALPNRTLLNDRLDQAIHIAVRSAKKVGVLFLDLDNFKNINDTLGHQVGDMLLRAVGKRLLGSVREEDTVARIGGDEFLILLPHLERGEEVLRVAEKVIATLTKPFLLGTHQIHTTTSIGISLFPDDAKEVPDLIKYADSALYEAKSRGRNNYQFFTQELNERITKASTIERCLRQAMESGELSLWYQPQVDIRNGAVIGAEALLRWRDESSGSFMPAEIIAVAEERGLITRLGEWTLREACKQCRLWQLKGLPAVPVAVNVSTIQLQQKEFMALVLNILEESDLDASYLELEITETSIMRKAQVVADLAMRLRSSGVRLSIDDFGTGYSSLSYLKHIPIDKIKIDRSFILDMLDDTEDETITEAIVKLGQSLRLRVIAEGVESYAQTEKLLSLGCHEAQGHLYSQAVCSDAFQAFLAEDHRFAHAME